MHIVVVGGGAIGLLYAARLAAFCRVTVLTRTPDQARRLQAKGLTYVSLDQVRCVIPITAHAVDNAVVEDADILLFAVKQGHVEDLLPQVSRWLAGSQPLIVMMQNGLGHMEYLYEQTGYRQIWAAVTTDGARRSGPTEVIHTGEGELWTGGYFPFQQKSPLLEAFVQCCLAAGISCTLADNMLSRVWDKLIINCLINPLTALLEVPNGALLELPHGLRMMQQLVQECISVAETAGVVLDARILERTITVCQRTARNRSSMLQDLDARRQTEIRWLNGALVEMAERKGIPVPHHRFLFELIEAKEGKYRNG